MKLRIILFLSGINSCLLSQQLNFRTYNVHEGLGHSQVSQIIEDEKGYLWFTLFGGGLSRFDGNEFQNYSEKNGLCSNLARPIIKDHKGIIWVGALGGKLCLYDGKVSKTFSAPGDTLPDKVYSIIEDHLNNIWLGTEAGVYVYDGKVLKHLSGKDAPPPVPVMNIYQDRNKNIWIAPWENGIYCFNGKNYSHFTMKDGLSYHTVMGFNEDRSGKIWVSTFKGVSVINTNNKQVNIQKFTHPYIDSTLIFKVTDDENANLYFATNGKGILTYNYKNEIFNTITVKNGLPGNIIYNIFRDHESNLWISCWGYGVTKFSGKRFVHFTANEGMLHDAAQAIAQRRDGTILCGTGNGLNAVKNNSVTVAIKEINNEVVYAVLTDDKDGCWISTSKAIYYYHEGKLKKYNAKDGMNAFPATTMALDKNNILWLGSWSGGVTKFDGTKFINYTSTNGLNSSYIYFIYPDKKNNIWICTWDGGLCKLSGSEFTYFKTQNGLPSNNVISAGEDKEGNLWIGTYGGGIAKFDGKNFLTINTANGLSDDACNGILFDRHNNLWVATAKGLDKIDAAYYNKTGKIKIRKYGEAEGFSAIECLRNAMYEDNTGKLWFGTKKGLACFNPEEDRENSEEPITRITGIRLFFERTDFSEFEGKIDSTGLPVNLHLPYSANHLTFDFVGISYTDPEKVRYRFLLMGIDKNWSPITNKREATYSGLPPGKYLFKLMACNGDELWNKNETVYEFEIMPPWYKTWWAYLLYGIAGVLSYVLVVRVRTKKLSEEKNKLEEIVKERTSEIVQQKNLVEEKNKEITDSIQYAKRIQSTLLAHNEFLQEHLSEYFVYYKPKDIVSGDFYWATFVSSEDTGPDLFYLAVCDSTGHGVPGAFMSLLNISFLNEAISEKRILMPGAIFNYVREKLISTISQEGGRDGMDGTLLLFEKGKNSLYYAAAHNKPVLIRDGEIIELSADKMPVGHGEKTEKFVTHEVHIMKGDCIYLYTDGYADQFGGEKGKKFKNKQLNELLIRICKLDLQEQKEILNLELEKWKGNLEQVDDICVIGIQIG